ncbi:MAG TPA: EamA family transporter [Thermomicrobiales bacterium]|nr:EamA family transporter [Thermomicrobiales bacterium]
MQTPDRVALVLLGLLWGGGFLFVRIAVPAFGPVALVDLRVLIAGVVLLLWVVARSELPPFWRRWREYLVLGALNVALPFTLIAWAALTVPASLGSILMATVPLFTAPVAAIQLNERVSGRQAAGLIVGFIGVGILVGLNPLPLTPAFVTAVSALLGAAALYALGGVYTARRFTGASPVESTIGQQFAAFALLLPFALAMPPRAWPPLSAVVALLILAVFSSVLAYLLFFRLISSVGATKTATVSYLIPLFGTLWGVVVAQERVGWETLAGMLVILFGVVLATGRQLALPRRRLAT